jgi:hypothetical protein
LPWRYSSWMQHWVITDDEPLGQIDEDENHRSGVVGLGMMSGRASSLYSLIFTDPTSTVSIRVTRSIFCDAAVPHISESTDRSNA